uniref:Methylenetetrahydrofolate reductase (NAD(P)H) n=1 Tax=Dunaliella tertiolecta TaxID=3047 RepID=A0A7S3QNC5_DUNTE
MSHKSVHQKWRLELFVKDRADAASCRQFLQENGIKRVNIPNKHKGEDLVGICQALQPNVDVCLHWSCKHQHQHRSMDKSMKHMVQTMQILHQQASAHSLLLVSGGGKRLKQFEACQVLDQLHPKEPTYGRLPLQLPIHCAFNPYLEGEAAAEERQRLQKKLQAGVAGVYLQIGTDTVKLAEGLDFLRNCTKGADQLQLHGSVLLPTRKLLAQMTFRPWSGVVLSKKFFTSVETANSLIAQVMRTYARYGVVPVIESPVSNSSELRRVHDLLDLYDHACGQH